jgi:hypothetical protein
VIEHEHILRWIYDSAYGNISHIGCVVYLEKTQEHSREITSCGFRFSQEEILEMVRKFVRYRNFKSD